MNRLILKIETGSMHFSSKMRQTLVHRLGGGVPSGIDTNQLKGSILGNEISSLQDPSKIFHEMKEKIRSKQPVIRKACVGGGNGDDIPFGLAVDGLRDQDKINRERQQGNK